MKHKVIFVVFFIFYLIVCHFHFRWEKYYEKYFGDPYDPYPVSTSETPSQIDNALTDFIAAWGVDLRVPQNKNISPHISDIGVSRP